jgi:hypothetical protein
MIPIAAGGDPLDTAKIVDASSVIDKALGG